MNKKLIFLSLLFIAFFIGCSKIPDTISKFQDGINSKDYLKVAETISKEASDYDSLANNNWSGLLDNIEVWLEEGTYTFSDIQENIEGEYADVNCSVKNDSGEFPSYFKMHNEGGILGLFRTWKIVQWKVDSNCDGFDNDNFRIQVYK